MIINNIVIIDVKLITTSNMFQRYHFLGENAKPDRKMLALFGLAVLKLPSYFAAENDWFLIYENPRF